MPASFIDDFTNLGGVVFPIVDVECLKTCSAIVKVGLSRLQKPIGELASVYQIALNMPGKLVQPGSGK